MFTFVPSRVRASHVMHATLPVDIQTGVCQDEGMNNTNTPAGSTPAFTIINPTSPQYRMASAIAMLQIEVRTGLKHSRGSILKVCQTQYGIKSRTKAKALAEMLDLYEDAFGRAYGSAVHDLAGGPR